MADAETGESSQNIRTKLLGHSSKLLFSRWLEITKDWAGTTSFHGFPNISRNDNRFLLLVWIVCVGISSGYCAYSIYSSIYGYMQFGVVTQIQNMYENPTDFPVVTICNVNPVVTQVGLNFSKYVLQSNGVDNVITSDVMKQILPYTYQGIANTYFLRDVLAANAKNASLDLRNQFGYSLDEMIFVCLYGHSVCDYTYFRRYYVNEYGNCFQFNSGMNDSGSVFDVLQTSKSEAKNGLTLMLFTGNFDDPNSLSLSTGAHIFIHNQTDSAVSTNGIDIGPGKTTNVAIKKIFSTQLPQPYNGCYEDLSTPDRFDSFFYRETLKTGYRYRQVDCLNLCEQDDYIRNCSCADSRYPTLYNTRYCTSLTDVLCISAKYSDIYFNKLNNAWFQYCPLECETKEYAMTVSTSDFPSESLAKIMLNDTGILTGLDYLGKAHTVENIRQNFAFVNIYCDYTGYTQISETPSQLLVDLLSAVGGTMGLYLGISFLSFVEVFELLFELIYVVFKRNTTRVSADLKTPND